MILKEFSATDAGEICEKFAKETLGEIRRILYTQEKQAKSLLAIKAEMDKLREMFEALEAHTSKLGGHQPRSVSVGENIHADGVSLAIDGSGPSNPLVVEDILPKDLSDKAIAAASERLLKKYMIVKGERRTYRARPYPY